MTPIISTTPPPWILPTVSNWLGIRKYYYHPFCEEPVPSIAIVSSKVSRPLYQQKEWFAKFKQVVTSCLNKETLILTSPGTTTHRFLQAYSSHHDLRLASAMICKTSRQWKNKIHNQKAMGRLECLISPPVKIPAGVNQLTDRFPLRDRLLIGGAHKVCVINCRHHSQTQQLLKLRPDSLTYSAFPTAFHSDRSATEISQPLRQPAVPHWIRNSGTLAHWTRAADCPWPQQSENSWYNLLIEGQTDADHSALATLRNIIHKQRILSSNQTIRGGYKVVCLTATPLHQWKELNVYRPHLHRWDFCPYGLFFSPATVKGFLSKPVRYGDEQLWNSLSQKHKPFFQAIDGNIDWRMEQEHRVVGDLRLKAFKSEDLVVFVRTESEVAALQPHSIWPVLPFEYLAGLAKIQK